jgi:hypothetical protein
MIKTDSKTFVKATGGGYGEYLSLDDTVDDTKDKTQFIFHQYQLTQVHKQPSKHDTGIGFGRISFQSAPSVPKLYLRVPIETDPDMLLDFMDMVWNLPRPKLIIGITGGARDFPVSPELEQVLNDLIQVARKTEAWLISGGTSGGIMKYIGTLSLHYNTHILEKFHKSTLS